MYIHKIVNQIVPNPGLEIQYNPRKKRKVITKLNQNKNSLPWARSLRNGNFFVLAPKPYNLIPANLCQLENNNTSKKVEVETVKKELEAYLNMIPDVPRMTENSLLQRLQ